MNIHKTVPGFEIPARFYPPVVDLGREICGRYTEAANREWLVTNSIGGYAAGTVAGTLTRRYHGLLIASLSPPLARTLLVAKVEETVHLGDQRLPIYTNHWASGVIEPHGFRVLERFHLEGTTPVWTFALPGGRLEKRVWMKPGANTTYLLYRMPFGSRPLDLHLRILGNYRDHHGNTIAESLTMEVGDVEEGVCVRAFPEAVPYYVRVKGAEVYPRQGWARGFFHSEESYRGLNPLDDHAWIADVRFRLNPGQESVLVLSLDLEAALDGGAAYQERLAYEHDLLEKAALDPPAGGPDWARQLALAADQFIVLRTPPGAPSGSESGQTVIAGYPWFGDWGRDTMISLPGLALSTGRPGIARHILATFAQYVDRGMLPNRFPDDGQAPEYNTVDATLWYFQALNEYYASTQDLALLEELFPVLEGMIDWHLRGTRYSIRCDPTDGLLAAGEAGVQLTWMDAKIGDWVVTPRIGKPVEINALWHNALQAAAFFARELGENGTHYEQLAKQAKEGFRRYWNPERGYLFDVLDTPAGNDPSLRPNQLLALSLPHRLLPEDQEISILEACTQSLYTSHGLRSLAADAAAYIGHYGGDQGQRDAAYHQGTVWAWLAGPYLAAHLRLHKNPARTAELLIPVIRNLFAHGLGTLSEIFEGDAPHAPRGCFAQAWSVAEVLRIWRLLEAWKRESGDAGYS